jgi:hypothetical protein
MKNSVTMFTATLVLLIAVLGCNKLTNLANVDMYQGDGAAKAAAAIKDKIGADKIGVIRAEVRKDSMKITIQAPDNPKNMDEYTFEKGRASGPKPVQAMSLGNLEMTGDKYHVTDFKDINFGAIPETVRQAIDRSGLENGRVDVITMDQQYAEMTHPDLKAEKKRKKDQLSQQIQDKSKECFKTTASKCFEELTALQKQQMNSMMGKEVRTWDLAWRLFVEGPRGRKDFYADKQGNLIENPY